MDSPNIVARINLPNMAYPEGRRMEAYASAREGLAELETDPEKRIKYSEFIDVYSGLSDEETARYREIYLKRKPQKEDLMGLTQTLMEEGRREGQREGLIEGIELALSLKFGDESRNLAERIAQIKDIGKLKTLKDIIRTAADADDIKKRLDN